MARLPGTYNTEGNNETMADRSALPAGDYLVHIVKSQMKETKARNGHYLMLQFVVLEGPYKGKSVFANLNLDNPSAIAVEIATKELNSICQALDLEGVEDSEELHQLPLGITVKVEEATSQYPESNSITAYFNEAEYEPSDEDFATEDDSESDGDANKKPWE